MNLSGLWNSFVLPVLVLITASILTGIGEILRRRFPRLSPWLWRRNIQITTPRTGDILLDQKPHGPKFSYHVKGTFNNLPSDCKIWILTENLSSRKVWPQSPNDLITNNRENTWESRIVTTGSNVKIHAVAAPPTTQDLFNYYQEFGSKTGWAALDRIPPECVIRADVQAKTPPPPQAKMP